MEQCDYCEQPLFETERVRWYDEYIHTECYEALLTDEVAIIVTEPPVQDQNNDMTAEVA